MKKIDKVPMQASLWSKAQSEGLPEASRPGTRAHVGWVLLGTCTRLKPVDERKCLMAQAGDRF